MAERAFESPIPQYRTTDGSGRTTSLLQCEIPATRAAVATMHRILGVDSGLSLQSGVEEGVCELDPANVVVDGGDELQGIDVMISADTYRCAGIT